MTWLLLSIGASSTIFVIFRLLPRMGAHTFPAIVVNYVVAAVCGLLMIDEQYDLTGQFTQPWFIAALLLGTLFISLFYLMAFTAQRIGVSVTSIATKMSLVVPVAWFMATDPTDAPTVLKVTAVLLAIAGVVLSAGKSSTGAFRWAYVLYPVIIFLGSGIIDLVIGTFSQAQYLQGNNDRYLFTAAPFITSTLIGTVAIGFRLRKGTPSMNLPTLIGGTVLGLVNFGSIFFLVRTFEAQLLDRSAIIPVNNLGIVLCSALASSIIFHEALSTRKKMGLGLSVLAIAILLYAGS
jgi:hypothetical protein